MKTLFIHKFFKTISILLIVFFSITIFAETSSTRDKLYISSNNYFMTPIPYANVNGKPIYYNNIESRFNTNNGVLEVTFKPAFYQYFMNSSNDQHYQTQYIVSWTPMKKGTSLSDDKFYIISANMANHSQFTIINQKKLNINNRAAYQILSTGDQSNIPLIKVLTLINFNNAVAAVFVIQKQNLNKPISLQIDWNSYNQVLASLNKQ